MIDYRKLIGTFGVPILLAISIQWVRVMREESKLIISVQDELQQHSDYTLGDFLLQWRNGSITIIPADPRHKRKYSLWCVRPALSTGP